MNRKKINSQKYNIKLGNTTSDIHLRQDGQYMKVQNAIKERFLKYLSTLKINNYEIIETNIFSECYEFKLNFRGTIDDEFRGQVKNFDKKITIISQNDTEDIYLPFSPSSSEIKILRKKWCENLLKVIFYFIIIIFSCIVYMKF